MAGIEEYAIMICFVRLLPGRKLHLGGDTTDLFEMAAAYIFYICQDHPFIDGNKRTALATGLVFLELNGVTITDSSGILYQTIMELAKGNTQKTDIAGNLFRDFAFSLNSAIS